MTDDVYRSIPGLLPDRVIQQLCVNPEVYDTKPMITPFQSGMTEKDAISYGLSSIGYDATLAPVFRVFTNVDSAIVDPKNFSDACIVERTGDVCIIPPNSFILGHTIETFCMPQDVMALCIGKSTYARCGIIVNVTPLEPGWEGQVTLEIHNTTPLPAKVYAHEGICQFLFIRSALPCDISYDQRNGKYMHQVGVVPPRIRKD